jgi:hypothetical protein
VVSSFRQQQLRRFANGASIGLVRAAARSSGGADHWAELFDSVQRALAGARAAEAALAATPTAPPEANNPATAAIVAAAAKPKPVRRANAVAQPLPAALSYKKPIPTNVTAMDFLASLPFNGVPAAASRDDSNADPHAATHPAVGDDLTENEADALLGAGGGNPVKGDALVGGMLRSLSWDGKGKQKLSIAPGKPDPKTAAAAPSEMPGEFEPARVFASPVSKFFQSVPWGNDASDAAPK